jgi:hypothetical protein
MVGDICENAFDVRHKIADGLFDIVVVEIGQKDGYNLA